MPKETTAGNPGYFVYFAQTECGKFLKIGCSRDPLSRMTGVRAEAVKLFPPNRKVRLLGCIAGDFQLEKIILTRFGALTAARREWFHDHQDLRSFINQQELISNPRRSCFQRGNSDMFTPLEAAPVQNHGGKIEPFEKGER